MTNVYITSMNPRSRSPLGGWDIKFAYDPDIVASIKAVKPTQRKYDPDTKTWTVVDYIETWALARRLQAAGYTVISDVDDLCTHHQRATPPPPPRSKPAATAPWADALFDAVGPDRIDAVHRALARILHPDTATGDADLMRALNVARDRQAVTR